MPERFALYYAPPVSHPIWRRAAQWLGRDPAGDLTPPVDIGGTETRLRLALTASARRYGFHATLKAPMAIAAGTGAAALQTRLAQFSRRTEAIPIGRLRIASLDGFLALVPEKQSDVLTNLVGEIVSEFEAFRAPLSAAGREKRLADGRLSPRQIAYLDQYGYPYVMEEFRFHMTLTDRLTDADRAPMMDAATEWFGPLLDEAFELDRIVLFHEREAGAAFMRLADYPLSPRKMVDA